MNRHFNYLVAVILTFSFPNFSKAQINFLNPGLNGASAAGAAPLQWTVCSSTPDVQPGQWCVNLAPKEGIGYAGFSDDEFIGQRLNCSLVKGKNYSMSLWLAYNPDYARTQVLGNCADRGIRGNPGNFQLWAGTTQCSKQELLYESGTLTAAHRNNWVQHEIRFKPNNTYDFILICAKPDDGSTNVLVDNISQQIIQEPDSFLVDNTEILCHDDKTGKATVYPPNIGGSSYTYLWNTVPPQTTQTAVNLGAGNYSCIVTDLNGACTSTFTVNVTIEAPDPLQLDMVCTDVTGPGANDGTSTANVSGGVPPYQYVWNTGASGTNSLSPLGKGTYSVTVTDAKGCKISDVCEVLDPFCDLEITDTLITHVSCFGASDGEIELDVSTSNGPVEYLWNTTPVQTGSKATNLGPGVYEVVISDAASCEVRGYFEITEPDALSITGNGTDASCFEAEDAEAQVQATGGTLPYTYSWPGGSDSSQYIGPAGNIVCTVTDANNCEIDFEFELEEPERIRIDTVINIASCKEISDAEILASATGGNGDFQFSIGSNFQGYNAPGISAFTGVSAGLYTLSARDSEGCIDSIPVEVRYDSVFVLVPNDTSICEGESIRLAASNMESITWNSGIPNNINQTPLSSTNYIAYGENASGCTANDTFKVNVIPVLDPTISPAGPFCGGTPDFQLQTADTGGTWSGLGVNSNGVFSASTVGDGTYWVKYQFEGSCGSADSIEIIVASSFDATINAVDTLCALSNPLTLSSTTPGGKWYGPGMLGNTTDSLSNRFSPQLAGPGTHEVFHLIPGECGDTAALNIVVVAPIVANIDSLLPICVSADPVQLTANTTEAVWSGQGTNASGVFNPQSVGSGTFKVKLEPTYFCRQADSITILVTDTFKLDSDTILLNCFNDQNGVVSTAVSGGLAPYTYQWQNGVAGNSASAQNLPVGSYQTIVSDQSGCIDSVVHVVRQPSQIQYASNPVVISDSCFEACKGAIFLSLQGGTILGEYNYQVGNTTQNNPNFTGLCAGTYPIAVTDRNSCVFRDTLVITEPNPISVDAAVQTAFCNLPNGGVQVNGINGGNPPYSFSWSNNTTDTSLSNAIPGTYTLTVRDSLLCEFQESYTVPNSGGPSLEFSVDSVSCFGASDGQVTVNVTNAIAPLQYQWNHGPTTQSVSGLQSQSYTVTVTDATGCSETQSVIIPEPELLTISPVDDEVLCFGQTFSLSPQVSGGNGAPYSFTANNNAFTPPLQTTNGGNISLVVRDRKGCSSPAESFVLSYLDPINALPGGPYTVCPGDTALLSPSATGGNGNYSFEWPDGSSSSSYYHATNAQLSYDSVRLVVSDACSLNDTIFIPINFFPNSSPQYQVINHQGCVPLTTDFTVIGNNFSSILWSFGDGKLSAAPQTQNTYTQKGNYQASLFVETLDGCRNTVLINPPIEVYPLPQGEIIQNPNPITIGNSDATFSLEGQDYETANWSLSRLQDTLANYSGLRWNYIFPPDTASYFITAVLTSNKGCQTTISRDIQVLPETRIFVPTAFSPDADGINDVFKIEGIGLNAMDFSFKIFDRWGEEIFSSKDPSFTWDGTYKGNEAKPGTYVWILSYRDIIGVQGRESGKLVLLD
ncbi:MAG: gliding motility-associated C-terminal domain-containing protein [Luteibaculum sp.]